jgi:hypothetical protein
MPKIICESSNRIMSWGYDENKKLLVVKRFRGNVQYFANAHKLRSLPTWDVRALSKVKFINHSKSGDGKNIQKMIERECLRGFDVFRPQQATRRRLKHVIDPITRRPQIKLYVKPAEVEMRVLLPER